MIITGKYPQLRLRRNRKREWSRRLTSENNLSVNDLILPIFIIDGKNKKIPIKSMPGVYRYSLDKLNSVVQSAINLGIPMVAFFPYTKSNLKNYLGTESLNPNNLVCRACRQIKKKFKHKIGIMCDVALDPYTSHGHDGVLDKNGYVENDKSLSLRIEQALTLAKAGADMVAPSDMMDGRISGIRDSLESNNFSNTIILSYAAKYSSKFYGPFRDAVGSSANLGVGSKDTYQMSVANIDEALHEVKMDIEEGADIVMVKPGMPYLDVIKAVKDTFKVPTFAYQVSGEYAMLKAAIENDWLSDEVILESLLSFKRAGADCVLTYAANEIAIKLNQ